MKKCGSTSIILHVCFFSYGIYIEKKAWDGLRILSIYPSLSVSPCSLFLSVSFFFSPVFASIYMEANSHPFDKGRLALLCGAKGVASGGRQVNLFLPIRSNPGGKLSTRLKTHWNLIILDVPSGRRETFSSRKTLSSNGAKNMKTYEKPWSKGKRYASHGKLVPWWEQGGWLSLLSTQEGHLCERSKDDDEKVGPTRSNLGGNVSSALKTYRYSIMEDSSLDKWEQDFCQYVERREDMGNPYEQAMKIQKQTMEQRETLCKYMEGYL